jgi:hypothetical protein
MEEFKRLKMKIENFLVSVADKLDRGGGTTRGRKSHVFLPLMHN